MLIKFDLKLVSSISVGIQQYCSKWQLVCTIYPCIQYNNNQPHFLRYFRSGLYALHTQTHTYTYTHVCVKLTMICEISESK